MNSWTCNWWQILTWAWICAWIESHCWAYRRHQQNKMTHWCSQKLANHFFSQVQTIRPAYNQSLALHTQLQLCKWAVCLSGQFSPTFSSPYLESGHMVPTYKGLCTAFNAISLGDLLQDSHFVDIFSKVSMFDSFPIKRSIQNKKNLFPSHLSKKKSAFFFSRHSVLVNDSPPIRSLYLLHRSF